MSTGTSEQSDNEKNSQNTPSGTGMGRQLSGAVAGVRMNNTRVTAIRPLNRFLKMAVMAGVENAIQIHIERGDDLNARDGNGLTLLMLMAGRNKSAMCKLLLDAGADKGLLDPSGKTAHAIAVAVGAHEAATALDSAIVPNEDLAARVPSAVLPSNEPSVFLADRALGRPTYIIDANATKANMAPPIAQVDAEEATAPDSTPDFNLFDWDPEEDCPPPEEDSSVAQAASAIQTAISVYEPIDSSVGWADIDAYLPVRSLPLARTGDAEARERLRLLLLRAVREGSVPNMNVEELTCNHDRSENPEAKAMLSMVINDLGAEVDERFEYGSTDENSNVFVNAEATPDEEEIVDSALTIVDHLVARHAEPLRIYQKEFQRARLISAEEEVALAQAMEIGLEQALDALAAWPRGISLTLAAGHLVKTSQRPLTWLSLVPVEAQPDIESVLASKNNDNITTTDLADEEIGPEDDSQVDTRLPLGSHKAIFLDALSRLASLPVDSIQQGTNWRTVHETISSLQLNRSFLLELADVEDDGDSASGTHYNTAMRAYQRARERMVVANLKLVFHIAKKYHFGDEPLDDLAQEGNIGLLKAVERFDWRRGFRFSTYATWWIRQQIGRHVANKCRAIRIPVHVYENAHRISRETQAFESKTGRPPEHDEIATRMGISVREVVALRRLGPEPLPIHDIPIDELIAVDARSDFVSPDPFNIVSAFELRGTIDKMLSTLKPKEEQILRLRFGIGIKDALTLDDIGQRYDVTRERIRQIEASAIRRFQLPSRMNALSLVFFGTPFAKECNGDERCAEPEITEQMLDASPMPHPVQAKGTPASLSTALSAKSARIDKLLTQAANLGIPIVDDSKGISGKIWINFIETNDHRYRQLARKLLALGFAFWPGKGYWR
jgi:RNA polymerase primary sigma factor